jgi:hypothetical protein
MFYQALMRRKWQNRSALKLKKVLQKKQLRSLPQKRIKNRREKLLIS